MKMRRKALNFGVIENEGPNSLKEYLARNLRTANCADIAVAFVTFQGIQQILGHLDRVARRAFANDRVDAIGE